MPSLDPHHPAPVCGQHKEEDGFLQALLCQKNKSHEECKLYRANWGDGETQKPSFTMCLSTLSKKALAVEQHHHII